MLEVVSQAQLFSRCRVPEPEWSELDPVIYTGLAGRTATSLLCVYILRRSDSVPVLSGGTSGRRGLKPESEESQDLWEESFKTTAKE